MTVTTVAPTGQPADQRPTAERIVDTAERLVQMRGYNGFSYADIAERVGVRTASIHYHFPTKADLGRQVVARYRAGFAVALRRIDAATADDPAERLRHYVALYRAVAADGSRMCLCGMLAAEVAGLPDALREDVEAFFTEQETWLTNTLTVGRDTGALRFARPPAAEALLLLAALEGALLLARARGDVAWFDTATDALLDALTAASSPG